MPETGRRQVIGDVEHVWDGSKWVPSDKSESMRKSLIDSARSFASKFKRPDQEAEASEEQGETLGKRIGFPGTK